MHIHYVDESLAKDSGIIAARKCYDVMYSELD